MKKKKTFTERKQNKTKKIKKTYEILFFQQQFSEVIPATLAHQGSSLKTWEIRGNMSALSFGNQRRPLLIYPVWCRFPVSCNSALIFYCKILNISLIHVWSNVCDQCIKSSSNRICRICVSMCVGVRVITGLILVLKFPSYASSSTIRKYSQDRDFLYSVYST